MVVTLWHYTCEHGRAGLGNSGTVLPPVMQDRFDPRMAALHAPGWAWFTDLAVPQRAALGLTRYVVSCDRIVHRYRVTDTTDVHRWLDVRRRMPARWRDDLESEPGARPAHWWVAAGPVPVVYDPVGALSA